MGYFNHKKTSTTHCHASEGELKELGKDNED